MKAKVETKIIGGQYRYRGTEHPRLKGEKVVVRAVRRHDHVDGDVVTLRDDGLIQALRAGDRVEVAQVVVEGDGRERESEVVAEADPEDLEPLPVESPSAPQFGRRW